MTAPRASRGASTRIRRNRSSGRRRVRAVNPGLVSHRRQAEALSRAITALDIGKEAPAEILAESVRQASHELASMVGRIGAEDYLDEIFSSFCIGK